MDESLQARLLRATEQDQGSKLLGCLSLPSTLENLRQRCVDFATNNALVFDEQALINGLARLVAGGTSDPLTDKALGEIHIEDLYLATVCSQGDSHALRRFAGTFGGDLDRAIAKSPALRLSADEFRQLVADRLFVAPSGRPPRISQYLGKGPLKAWLRVMTSRFVIDLSRRQDKSTVPTDGLAEKIGAAQDTELDYFRHAYGSALDTAFAQAVTKLSIRERNLLRQRYLHETPGDTLAKMYGVHRSTIFLWLDNARHALREHLRGLLAQSLPGDQLDSVVGLLGSQLQLSVRRILDSQLESDPG